MSLTRRQVLAATLSAPLVGRVHANAPVDVVKLMSLSCSVCLSAESQDKLIVPAVRREGGRFVWAPVPTHPDDEIGAAERTYYAARDLNELFGEAVKMSLYKGIQDQGLELFNFMQILTWLRQDLPQYDSRLEALMKNAQLPGAQRSLVRAVRLAVDSGAKALPCYLVMQSGRVLTTFDPTHPKAPTLTALREEVLAKVAELNKQAS